MIDTPRLRLGTRQSPLAMIQAQEARSRLCAAHGWSEDEIELVSVRAAGDKVQDRPLAELGGKALWTKELDRWLVEGRIDAAVHSMKDVETIRPRSIAIGAILPRADIRDVLVGAGSIADIPRGAIIGTTAPRRAAQLLHHRPDCKVVTFRGNVATRLARLAAGEVDATFLAAAGLERLGETGTGTPLAAGEWLPAPAQGAIGIEYRSGTDEMQALLAAIDDPPSSTTIKAERALLAGLGGTCHSPVAALSLVSENEITLRAALFSPDGIERVDGEAALAMGKIDAVADLASDLLERATPGILPHFHGPR